MGVEIGGVVGAVEAILRATGWLKQSSVEHDKTEVDFADRYETGLTAAAAELGAAENTMGATQVTGE